MVKVIILHISRFYSQTLYPNEALQGIGEVNIFDFNETREALQFIENNINSMQNSGFQLDQIVILTTEYDPIHNSILFRKTIRIDNQNITIGEDADSSSANIPLYTVSSFKGLETDSSILFVPSMRDNLETYLYVGISRSRYLLNIVINKSVVYRISQLQY